MLSSELSVASLKEQNCHYLLYVHIFSVKILAQDSASFFFYSCVSVCVMQLLLDSLTIALALASFLLQKKNFIKIFFPFLAVLIAVYL